MILDSSVGRCSTLKCFLYIGFSRLNFFTGLVEIATCPIIWFSDCLAALFIVA